MALFRLPSSGSPALAPRGNGLVLRAPQMSDFLQWAHLRETSRNYLTPWEPIWPSDDLTRAGFRRRLRRYAEDIAADRSYPFIVFREADGAMIGGITLANVRRGIVQAGTIGYWVGAAPCPSRLHDRGVAGAAAVAVRRTQSAPHRGRLHSHQCAVDPGAGEMRLYPRGPGAALSLHQRRLAGPSAVRPAARGFSRLSAEVPSLSRALGSPPLRCYKAPARFGAEIRMDDRREIMTALHVAQGASRRHRPRSSLAIGCGLLPRRHRRNR